MDDYSGLQPTYTTVDENTSSYSREEAEKIVVAPPIAKSVPTLIICITGLIGNVVVIFVIITLKEYRKTVTNWYILQLAFADSLFLLVLPFQVSEDIQDAWIYPEWLCKAMNTIRFHNYYASIFFFTIMSMDRYIAVCHSFSSSRFNQFRERKSAVIITISVWIIALLLCIPIMLYSFKMGFEPNCHCGTKFPHPEPSETIFEYKCKTENGTETEFQRCLMDFKQTIQREILCVYRLSDEYDENATTLSYSDKHMQYNQGDHYNGYDDESYYGSSDYDDENNNMIHQIPQECHYDRSSNGWLVYIWFNFAAMFILPFIIMSICYGLIIYRLSSSNPQARTNSISSQTSLRKSKKKRQKSKSERDKVRVTRMCAILVMSFLLSWILFHATHIAKTVGIKNATGSFCQVLTLVSLFSAYLNSALNPFLYSFLDAKFKERFQKAVRTLLKKVSFFPTKASTTRRRSKSGTYANTSKNSISGITKTSRMLTGRKSLSSIEQPAATDSQSNQIQLQLLSPVANLPTDQVEVETVMDQKEKN